MTLTSWFTAAPVLPLPQWYLMLMVGLFSAAVGSFLNVCIYRVPEEDMSVFYPPNSHCPKCGYKLRWYDNIPILSWVSLLGRCRSCKSPISTQYPLVELMTTIMGLAVYKVFGLTWATLLVFLFICALIVITFIDLQHWIIPDIISLPGVVIGLVGIYFFSVKGLPTFRDSLFGALLGGGTLAAISLFYEFVMKREGMGFGDVKLLALIGVFVGWRGIPLVVLLASLQGTIAAVALYLAGWRATPPYDDWEENNNNSDIPESSANNESETKADKEADAPKEATPAEDSAVEDSASEDATAEGFVVESSATTETASENADVNADVNAEIAEPAVSDELATEGEAKEDEDPGIRGIAIPFGPFLSLGAIEVLFWGEAIYRWLLG